MTLRGPGIAEDFKAILRDYIDKRYGAGERTAAE
jgi:(E)-4-hydroxy-3-methylbut-2-enyl-diphosphate synthase